MNKNSRIYIAGHNGLIGSALIRQLQKQGYEHLITASHADLDLNHQQQVQSFFEKTRPEYVFLAAGKVGGLYANNTYRAEFIYENLILQCHAIHQAFLSEVTKLIFFGCVSIYPKLGPQPMKEESILGGSLEPTNEPFAIAKIAGLKMCEAYNQQYGTDFVSVIPTNIYGVNQSYESMNAPVIPSLICKFHKAKETREQKVTIWGTGRPARDFLFADDLADATIFLMNNYPGNDPINIGTGKDHTIRELAEVIKRVVGYEGDIVYDTSRPDGVGTRLQDVSKITRLGWKYRVDLEEGIQKTYNDFLERKDRLL